ncbi:DUF1428 domain-containing protein [Hyphococcus flavus]|uniref:DUF1428 domain-containing protein n=1 Tax=Hyphococcus flavus TaxID=1866326 RepID=A0AAF0CC07_9PROT|nr:DUF1428 domain-containing protein [Hyphococcus flavus]WDI32290.1 DUF1428 domain-containing protein [Hyphococcus flavus]
MTYVDGFIIPVHADNREKYRAMAALCAPIFKKHGALSVVECWADDVPEGKVTSFPMAVKVDPGEEVVFSWITWPSRKVRDEGNKKAMEELHGIASQEDVPFDGKRMIFGGFEVIVEE